MFDIVYLQGNNVMHEGWGADFSGCGSEGRKRKMPGNRKNPRPFALPVEIPQQIYAAGRL
jgi:hypothetical protein